jgi:trimeric autotransporter adhesin
MRVTSVAPRKRSGRWIAAGAVALVAVHGAALAKPSGTTGTSPNGGVSVTIDSPAPRTHVAAGLPVQVTGTTNATGSTATDSVVYIVDVSASTADAAAVTSESCGDVNGDGSADTVLDCELAGLEQLTSALPPTMLVAVVAYANEATAADMNPAAAGTQFFATATADEDLNGSPDVVDALKVLESGGGIDLDAALDEANSLAALGVEAPTFLLLSHGSGTVTTGPGSPLAVAADDGVTIIVFAVGQAAGACAPGTDLQVIAATTHGTCSVVDEPAQIAAAAAALSGAATVGLVEVEVNNMVLEATSDGHLFSATVPASALRPGRNVITVRAAGAGAQAGEVAVAATSIIRTR